MDKIQVQLVDHTKLDDNIAIACSVTRAANKVQTLNDFWKQVPQWSNKKVNEILQLPHSKLARFVDLYFVIVGSSRRFLAQITTHKIGIDIISGSLQYSNWSKRAIDNMFVVPYHMLDWDDIEDNYAKAGYLSACKSQYQLYKNMSGAGIPTDELGYLMPEGLRNVLYIKVNLAELMYIGNQRLCRRNTEETRYVVGLMIEQAVKELGIDDSLFMPSCYSGVCKEGKYSCRKPYNEKPTISEILDVEFPLLRCAKK